MNKVTLVLGIRPDVIRASKLIKILRQELGNNFELVWTGQHYSENLKDVFFEQLNVGFPEIELGVVGSTDAELVSSGIVKLYEHLSRSRPSVAIFLGDTNTVMTCIAAAQLNIPIIHIEGCMRSFDWRMPEEKYRTVIDHLADHIFAYTENYKMNGLNEGIPEERIHVVGNPIVDVLDDFVNTPIFKKNSEETLKERNLVKGNFFLATTHRRENIESRDYLSNIFKLFGAAPLPVVIPLGYRTQRLITEYKLEVPDNVKIEEPIDYKSFLALTLFSKGVITDSGTVVEEACILGIPSIQMRHSTERPEVYDVGASVKFDPVRDYDYQEIYKKLSKLHDRSWTQPFGDGHASEKMAYKILQLLNSSLLENHQPNMNSIGAKRAFRS